jgi:DNA-binding transcriptional LysR family regulator
VREGHPRIKGTIDLDTYLSLDHVLVSSRRSGHGPEDIALAREGLKRTVAIRCQHITTAMCLISGSDLVLTMSEVFARRANGMFDHQIVRPPFSTPPIDTYLFWHANGDADPANQWPPQMIENVCHSLTLNANYSIFRSDRIGTGL